MEKDKLPRRFGKDYINKEIEKQNGIATKAQLAGIAINNLKNLYVNLERRIINDMFLKEKKFKSTDYKTIIKSIKDIETIINPLLTKDKVKKVKNRKD